MSWFIWVAIAAFCFCVLLFIVRFLHLLKLGAPKDLSKPAGKVSDGVLYSCTVAMLPQNKESAYLHLPTYTAGILFHIGNFLSLASFVWLFIAILLGLYPSAESYKVITIIHYVIMAILAISSICGLAVLVKRVCKKELREISSFDDYFSNLVCSLMQIFTILYLLCATCFQIPYFLMISIVFIWMPLGKIKHLLFFFMARYHLGFFYGRRGSWPPAKID